MRFAVNGFVLGGVAVFLDAYIAQGLFGLTFPLFCLFVCFFALMAIVGIRTSENPLGVVLMVVAIPAGIVATNTLRQYLAPVKSVLTSVGM